MWWAQTDTERAEIAIVEKTIVDQQAQVTRLRLRQRQVIGLAIAASRVGSAVSTFLLPVVVNSFGVQVALGACAIVLAGGAVFLHAYAPETRGCSIETAPALP